MTDTIPDKATNDQSEIMDSPQTAQEATQQPVQKTGYQAKWIVQDFFECLDWLYLPQCMAQSLMHVNWKKYWKKGGPRVAWEVIRSLTRLNAYPYFIDRNAPDGWAGPKVINLLSDIKVKVIGGAHCGTDYFFDINERWAFRAQQYMLANGVPFTPFYDFSRIHIPGDAQLKEARTRRPSFGDMVKDAWGQAKERQKTRTLQSAEKVSARRGPGPGSIHGPGKKAQSKPLEISLGNIQVWSVIMKISMVVIVLVVAVVLGGNLLAGCAPGPEELARAERVNSQTRATEAAAVAQENAKATAFAGEQQATATSAAVSAQATATSNAVAAQATGDANRWQATATAAAWMQQVQATMTAVPNQSFNNNVANSNAAYRQWVVSLIGITGGALAGILLFFALVAFVTMQAKIVRRDKSGQLPAFFEGGVLTDPMRSLGSTQIRKPGLVDYAFWITSMAITRQLLPAPQTQMQVHDGNASAEQLLEAARSANLPATLHGIFEGGQGDPKKLAERIEVLRQTSQGGLLRGAGENVKLTLWRPGEGSTDLAALIGSVWGVDKSKLLAKPAYPAVDGEFTRTEMTDVDTNATAP